MNILPTNVLESRKLQDNDSRGECMIPIPSNSGET